MKLAVEDVAYQIRRILRHDKMSIVERHTLGHVSCADADRPELQEMCGMLLECAGLAKHYSIIHLTILILLKVQFFIP